MFRQLSFDTSNSDVHLALLEGDVVVRAEVVSVKDAASGTSRQEAANLLIPSIDNMMREVAWMKPDLDGIIVGTGPGGFTGIRTAVVTARALAQALYLPLYPVSILEALGSALPDTFVIILYATIGHYFLARGTAHEVVLDYVSQEKVAEFVGDAVDFYVDERASIDLSGSLPSTLVLKSLPEISNVAVQQAKFAWPHLSLKVNAIYERLNQLDASNGNDTADIKRRQLNLHQELCREFSYDVVVPTYLRAPSVTLKKNV